MHQGNRAFTKPKETLNKSTEYARLPLSRAKETDDESSQSRGLRVRQQEEEDPPGSLPLEDGTGVVSWKALLKLIEPFYPTAGPYPMESILRVHLIQNGMVQNQWDGRPHPKRH